MELRKHQADMKEYAGIIAASGKGAKVLVYVVPGGGKSWLPMLFLKELPPDTKLIWAVPRVLLREQAAQDALKYFQMDLREIIDAGDLKDPSRGTRGFILSHDLLMGNVKTIEAEMKRHKYLLVVDEFHHAGIHQKDPEKNNKLGTAMSKLDPYWLLAMTGTLERNDNLLIHGVKYELNEEGRLVATMDGWDHVVRYDRVSALEENALVPMHFYHTDGPVEYRKNQEDVEIEELSKATKKQEGAALFTALETGLADDLFDSCMEHFLKYGEKLLVVCARQEQAKRYSLMMPSHIPFCMAIDDNEKAAADVKQFKKLKGKAALFTCMMAYEGLDVPEFSHGCCLTHIRSVPWIEQLLGRLWRAIAAWKILQKKAKPKTHCSFFCPDDPRMNRTIAKVQKDQMSGTMPYIEGGEGPGNEFTPVLPKSSGATNERKSVMDDVVPKEVADAYELLSLWSESTGRPIDELGDEAGKADAADMLGKGNTIPIREREQNLRRRIKSHTASLDKQREVPFGTHAKKLIRVTNKSTEHQNESELIRTWDIVTNPNFRA